MVFLKSIFIATTLLLLTGCQIPYLVKSAYNHLSLISKAEDIKEVLKKDTLTADQKRKLLLAQSAREFAEKKLGLKQTKNYTEYVALDRDYVSYVLSVSPAFELKTHTWWFPIVGSVPYKGYKTPKEAYSEAKNFDSSQFDTYVRGASAYSTLGWFNDPILSSMLRYRDYNIVNIIIHETVHATIYIKSQADFNERLASFIGNIGTEIYYKALEGDQSKTLEMIKKDQHDEKLFSEFISTEVDQLKKWYIENKPVTQETKAERLDLIKQNFKEKVQPKMKTTNYAYFLETKINNAFLLSLKTYVYDLSDFQKVYDHFNQDFKKFVGFSKSLEKEEDPEKALKNYLK